METLKHLGYTKDIEEHIREHNPDGLEIGRIISEHKERYILRSETGDFEAEITGNMRFTAKDRMDFPAVGDWVAYMPFDRSAIIHKIIPRFSSVTRQSVGKATDIQLIAANIDYAFIVQSLDQDYSINRMERYLTICYASKVNPLIVFTKADLLDPDELRKIVEETRKRIKEVPVVAVSSITKYGYPELVDMIMAGKTYCLLGSSGAGKSSLLNALAEEGLMETKPLSNATGKGRHTTSHRELFVLQSGGIIIDTPGMREVGITDSAGALETAFQDISEYAGNCKYRDCSHIDEDGCAVLEALHNGEIDEESYQNYLKLEKERAFFESSMLERRRKDKELGKIIKHYKNMGKTRK